MTETKKIDVSKITSPEPMHVTIPADAVNVKADVPVVNTTQTPEDKLRDELERWWLDLAHTEINALVPKAIEYGGVETDAGLIGMGRDIVEAGFPLPQFTGTEEQRKALENEFYAELAIYTYMQGKMARWKSALRRGRFVGDDTVHDLGIYSRMVQRIRDCGGWPTK